jgi:hypothetical protein
LFASNLTAVGSGRRVRQPAVFLSTAAFLICASIAAIAASGAAGLAA